MPNLLNLSSVSRIDLEAIFFRSRQWNQGEAIAGGPRARIATVFNGPAFRTRLAFDTAIDNIGGHRVDLPMTLGEREPIEDTAAIFSSAVDAVVIRHGVHSDVLELARHSMVPIVNAMTDLGHPCEVISEAFTMLERRGSLDGMSLTFVGEPTNLFRSWCELSTRFAIKVTQVAPPGYAATEELLAEMRGLGGNVSTTTDLSAGLAGADVLYTDGWPRAAQEPDASGICSRGCGSHRMSFPSWLRSAYSCTACRSHEGTKWTLQPSNTLDRSRSTPRRISLQPTQRSWNTRSASADSALLRDVTSMLIPWRMRVVMGTKPLRRGAVAPQRARQAVQHMKGTT